MKIRATFLVLASLSSFFFGNVSVSNAQSVTNFPKCAPFKQMKSALWDNFKEKETVILLAADGYILHVFINEETETWTVIRTLPKAGPAQSCIIDSGKGAVVYKSYVES